MARNRHRSTNSLQFRSLWKLVAVCCILTAFGLVFVFLQIRTMNAADEIKKLETVLDQVRGKNNALLVQIQHGKSPTQLQRQIVAFRLGLVDMNHPQIVVLDAPVSARPPDSIVARGPRTP
jgi:cell division protein FtsL